MDESLKQKEKEISKLSEKLRQAELSLGRQKILQKDRKNFHRFCKFLAIADADLVFESAAAKEVPVDIEELQAAALPLRDAATTIREFSELVLGHPVTELSALRTLWLQRSDSERTEDTSQISMVVHDQLKTQAERIERLEAELRNANRIAACAEKGTQTERPKHGTSVTTQTEHIELCVGHVDEAVVKQLETAIGENEKKYIYELKISDEKTQKLLQENLRLQSAIHALETERDKYGFIEDIALRQAERDAEISRLRHELAETRAHKGFSTADVDERKILLKNIFIKFVGYAMLDDLDKMHSMIPIARELFELTDGDVDELQSICTGPSLLNSLVSGWNGLNQK